MNNIEQSHIAFSDDSSHGDGRFKSLALITISEKQCTKITPELQKILLKKQ